jgi:hypothetical protein
MPCPNAPRQQLSHMHNLHSLHPIFNFRFSIFLRSVYDIPMAEHIEDIQHRYVDLKKRMELVRSYL